MHAGVIPFLDWISIHAPVKGATCLSSKKIPATPISLPAPVKGATRPEVFHITGGQISIHAPVKGATKPIIPVTGTPPDFNPRSREGSDQIDTSRVSSYLYFNPRSREGSDVDNLKDSLAALFQSTLP